MKVTKTDGTESVFDVSQLKDVTFEEKNIQPDEPVSVSLYVTETYYNSANVQLGIVCSDMSKIKSYGIKNIDTGKLMFTSSNNPLAMNYITLTGLSEATSYKVKGNVMMNDGTEYESDVRTFTTPAKSLTLNATASAIDHQTAIVRMVISGDALSEVAYGVDYALSEQDLNDPGRCTSVKGTDALSDVNGQTKTITLSPLQPLTTYYWRAWVSRQSKRTSTDGSFTTPEVTEVKIPMAVDLGLSVKWASFNIGAESEEDYGGLYGFGDGTGLNRSINNGDYAKGKVFSTIGGDPDYDLATATLGEHWRLPTCKEIEELNQCNPQYRTKSVLKNGVYVTITGWELTGKTGNTIFIPCAGVRTLADDSSIKDRNTYAYIWSDSVTTEGVYYTMGYEIKRSTISKARGLSIRAVYDDGTGSSTEPAPDDPTNMIVEGSDQNEDTGIIPQDGVDMGRNIKWSRWNFGVMNKTGEYGRYYAWGETEVKDEYTNTNYNEELQNKEASEFTNYNFDKTCDVVAQNWGDGWRMPTAGEITELIGDCDITWTTEGGIQGYKFTHKVNKRSIFFPAGGQMVGSTNIGRADSGRYWSTSAWNIGDAGKKKGWASHMYFSTSTKPEISGVWRYYGMLIRPVRDK